MAVLILSVGRDATLLAIRSLILANAGYDVVAAASEKEFMTRFQNGDFDAVVLCHTLPEDQRKRIRELVRSHSPSTPVVVMADGAFPAGPSDDHAMVLGDTRDLIRVLPEILRSNQQRRAL